jgi:hypothetical protein
MRRANFRNQKTLAGFDFNRLPGLNRAAVHDLATCRFIDEKVAVLIAGPCGTGKSHLAQSLGHAAARQGYDVLFITQTQLMASPRTAQAMGTYERRQQPWRLPVDGQHLHAGRAALKQIAPCFSFFFSRRSRSRRANTFRYEPVQAGTR